MKRRNRRHQAEARSGVSAVEFAIVANVLFVLVFTCMEFARMNMVRNLTQDAAYFAARHVVVPGATAAEAEAEAERIMSAMLDPSGYEVDISALDENSTEVTVTITVNLDHVALFVPMFMGNTTIETQARMRTERYEGYYNPNS